MLVRLRYCVTQSVKEEEGKIIDLAFNGNGFAMESDVYLKYKI